MLQVLSVFLEMEMEIVVWRTPKEPSFQGDSRGQGNFELVANFGYDSRGSADPRESLRKRRISKLALTAHKVLPWTVQSAFGLGIGENERDR